MSHSSQAQSGLHSPSLTSLAQGLPRLPGPSLVLMLALAFQRSLA